MATLLLALLLGGCISSTKPPNIADTQIPLRLPTADRFTFGPGDSLKIFVWRHDDLSMEVTVAPDGYITYPLIGRVKVADTSYEDLVKTLQTSVDEYYVDAKVSVNVTMVMNQKVIILGEVQNPQVVQVTNDLSILEALTRAGGINPEARTRNVLVIRGGLDEPVLFTVDVQSIYGKGDLSQLVFLQKGDIVYVPTNTITNVERFFRKLQSILAPAVGASAVYRNVVSGGAQGTSSVLE
jgi:polysaccharide export outer membrane protein